MSVKHQNIKRIIINHLRRLQILEEQKAFKGLDTEPHILAEIQDIKAQIKRLRKKLAILENKTEVDSSTESNGSETITILEAVKKNAQEIKENKRLEADLAKINTKLASLEAGVKNIDTQLVHLSPPHEKPSEEIAFPSLEMERLESELAKINTQLADLFLKLAASNETIQPKDRSAIDKSPTIFMPSLEMKHLEFELKKLTIWLTSLLQPEYKQLSINAIGIIVISTIITSLPLDVEGEDIVRTELKWLFTAASHFSKVRRGQQDSRHPVPIAIPLYADSTDHRNIILINDETQLRNYEKQIEIIVEQIKYHLDMLNYEWDNETTLAEWNTTIKNSIKSQLWGIIKNVEELAEIMNSIYGVLVLSPSRFAELLN